MTKIMKTNYDNYKYEDAVKYILDIPRFSKKTDNNTINQLLERIGNPKKDLKVIHLAGTNGKGSTCAFLNSILLCAGKTVGMFTSPHLVRINERIKINGSDVSDETFLAAFKKIMSVQRVMLDEGYSHLSFFEILFVLAIYIFKEKNVEYAILETGLGGRLDATNIISKPVVSIITTISMDHMEILGDTIEKIAEEKAGIIKKDVPVLFFGEDERVKKIIENKANQVGTTAYSVEKDMIKITGKNNKAIDFCIVNMYDRKVDLSIPFKMEYQVYNATLAICALNHINGLNLAPEIVKEGLTKTFWPGRMEEVMENVFLDGAHNEEGLSEFVKYVGEIKEEVHLLFSVVKEKDYEAMIKLLGSLSNVGKIVVAPVNCARALSIEKIVPIIGGYSAKVVSKDSVCEAFEYAVSTKSESTKLFCVGSLYMVGEIKEYLEKGKGHHD